MSMNHPAFFNDAPVITVQDGLARLLGACSDGLITYRYLDAVQLAGHSCPTVAGAWLMTRRALALLYPDGTPERGGVRVRFAAAADAGVTGVIASVASLVTGAAGPGGFKGIGGAFQRRGLMDFDNAIDGETSFERLDNGASVRLTAHLQRVEGDPRTGGLLRKIFDGLAAPEEAAEFAALWQGRVKRILIDHADDPELISAEMDAGTARGTT